MNFFKDILGLIFNKFKIFIVILLFLTIGPYATDVIHAEFEKREELSKKTTQLKDAQENISKIFDAEKSNAEKRIDKLSHSGTKILRERINQIDKEVTELISETNTPIETVINSLSGDLDEVVTNRIKLGILEQERKYLGELYNFTLSKEDRKKKENKAEKVIKTNKVAIKRINSELEYLKRHPNCYIPGTDAYKECDSLEKQLEQLTTEISNAEERLQKLRISPDELSATELETRKVKLLEVIKTDEESRRLLQQSLENLQKNQFAAQRLIGTDAYNDRKNLKDEIRRLTIEIAITKNEYQRLADYRQKSGLPVFFRNEIDNISKTLDSNFKEIEERLNKNHVEKFIDFLNKIIEEVMKHKEMASIILLSIILTPFAIKAFFYYIIAPIASRFSPIYLLPNVSGIITAGINNEPPESVVDKFSAPSLTVSLKKNEELFVHQGCIQQMPSDGVVDTEFVLNWKYPVMSIAAGMYNLTRIRESDQSCKIGANPADKMYIHKRVGLISIPSGSAIIFQPHYLVGVIQQQDQPVKITSHWRFGSLNAWLTLQLRYLAFHGPVKLIIEGCNGVNVECADKVGSINQASTIGFSANLNYSTSRSKPFVPYLMGRQELFNDNFIGASSYYIYEQTPYCGKKGNILTGRGIEGITDSILKVFGI